MDRQRLADALAYEQGRRRRLASVVPMPASGQPETASTPSLRSNLENLSIGLGEGLTNQLEGVRALVTDPIGTAKGTYEAVRGVVRDPSVIAQALREMGSRATSGPLGAGEVVGEMLGPMRDRPAPDMLELDVYHGTPHRFPATEANPLGEFDASKIGTGKGRNLKGKGIYLTENPERAKEYAESFVQPGFVYKSDLPDEMIKMMMEYDVPIKNQPENVKKALKTLGIDPESSELAGTIVSGLREGANLIAEEALAKAGIPGMKVKNIRAKEKKYDFVVFPGEEKKVRILERK